MDPTLKRKIYRQLLFFAFFNNIFFTATSMNYVVGYLRNIEFNEIHVGIYGSSIGVASILNFCGLLIAKKSGGYKKAALLLSAVSITCCFIGLLLGYLINSALIRIMVLVFLLFFQMSWYMGIPIQLSWQYQIIKDLNWQKYFSSKMIYGDIAILITSWLAGSYLGKNPDSRAFMTVFFISTIIGAISCYLLSGIGDMQMDHTFSSLKGLIEKAISLFRSQKSRNLLVIIFLRIFAYGIIAPFQPVFLLEKIKFSYAMISLMVMLGTVASIIAYKIWARMQTRFGNLNCLKWNLLICIFEPLLWFIASEKNTGVLFFAYILFGFSGMQGLVNAGYFSSCLGAIVENPSENATSIYMSMYFVVYGAATMIAPLFGGIILRYYVGTPTQLFITDGYKLLFLIADFLLILVAILAYKLLHEKSGDSPQH